MVVKRKKQTNIFTHVLFIFSGIILSFSYYIKTNFVSLSFEQLLYSATNLIGTGYSSIREGILTVLVGAIIIYFILWVMICFKRYIHKTILTIKYKQKEIDILLFPFQKLWLIGIILFIISILVAMQQLNIYKYLENRFIGSDFYVYNYVDPRNVELKFPEKKRNLIYIYLESMQSDFVSKKNGGILEESIIPKLEQLALENINFSENSSVGGARVFSTNSWTVAAMVGQTSGVTFNIPLNGNLYSGLGSFMPGVITLGDILKENGYINYLIMGSNATFGGRRDYFTTHGDYQIFDYPKALELSKLPTGYGVWWGYEDKKLFEFAKEQLLEIAKEEEPFNYTMLTADTHFTDGYLDETCDVFPFQDQYRNVFYCNDNMIYEFVRWIQEQDFYENTTVVLSGDHYSMQTVLNENRYRTYNVFINSIVDTQYSKNREYSILDMFPTTFAAMGVEITGERLGLGTNLFSGTPTLIELYGYDYIEEETVKKSDFYNNTFLRDDYEKLTEKGEK